MQTLQQKTHMLYTAQAHENNTKLVFYSKYFLLYKWLALIQSNCL